jgi:hypothetical protein
MIALYVLLASPPVVLAASPRSGADTIDIRPVMNQQVLAAAGPMTVDVDVTTGGRSLWHGSLRLEPGTAANYNTSTSQAVPSTCAAPEEDDRRTLRHSLQLSLNLLDRRTDGRVRFSVNWSRPGEECSPNRLDKSVQLSGVIQLPVGKPVSVEGDGGLRIQFTRG